MATTRSRPRGRESARLSSDGVTAEHVNKIYGVAIGGVVVIIAFLTLTSIGHVIDLAVQHFMLYFAGVFALIALCASVGLGLIATDRMVLNPGHRIFVQSAHRAASFGALAFLVIHIVTEILAQRVHVIDSFVPFLSPFRTFYIGLGTIASDLIVLLVITGIMRKRFTSHRRAWRWRAIHYTSYMAFAFGVWHGLLGGRPGKPYVDWSYGFVVAFVALGLAVRVLANSLHPKENLSVPPVSEMTNSGSAPMHAAAMFARADMIRAALPAAMTAAFPSMAASTAVSSSGMTIAALPATESQSDGRQPIYESGYEGPPRYAGAPRNTGPLPTMPISPMPRAGTGPMPRAGTGPIPTAGAGPRSRPGTGPMPRAGTGPIPTAGSGPRSRPGTGPIPRAGTGPIPRAGTGPIPAAGTGPMPRAGTGPIPTAGSGPRSRPGTGPLPRAGTGPIPQGGAGQRPQGAGQPPWDGGIRAPEPDPSLKYREPGPGMPGYRGSSNRFRGGDNLR